jgi:hypothetical protein
MLECAQEILPISRAEWDMVAARHAAFNPDLDQTGDQLKQKFNKLVRTIVPTGNPNIPPAIREAKEIQELIIEKSKGVTCSEEEIFSPDDVEDNNNEVGMEEQEEVDNGDIMEEGLSVAAVSHSCLVFDSLFSVVSYCLIGRICDSCSSCSSYGHSHHPLKE